MNRIFALMFVLGLSLIMPLHGRAQDSLLPAAATPADKKDSPPTVSAGLPPIPSGTSTIFGGAIRKVDPVLDQIQLNVYGERPMKILYDQRTQVFRDGVRIPLLELKPADHASVQTTLDGSKIFAISIHILSQSLPGQYRGLVLSFDSGSGQLSLDAAPSPNPFRVYVPQTAKVSRTGQGTFTSTAAGLGDLRPGALVDVTFGADRDKEGVASQIDVLAVPGSSFVFVGDITALDMGAGFVTVKDPRDQKSYRISFDPKAIRNGQDLRTGQRVRITASFLGGNYVAGDIAAY